MQYFTYKILDLIFVNFNWILLEWFISGLSSLYFTSPDNGRVKEKSLQVQINMLAQIENYYYNTSSLMMFIYFM